MVATKAVATRRTAPWIFFIFFFCPNGGSNPVIFLHVSQNKRKQRLELLKDAYCRRIRLNLMACSNSRSFIIFKEPAWRWLSNFRIKFRTSDKSCFIINQAKFLCCNFFDFLICNNPESDTKFGYKSTAFINHHLWRFGVEWHMAKVWIFWRAN